MSLFFARKPARFFHPAVEPLEQRIAPATFLVTTMADSGAGSLRQAIIAANSSTGPDLINFDIPGGSGPRVIQPLSLLPVITEGVVIDGYSQPSSSANTLAIGSDAVLRILLDGSQVPNLAGPESGLVFTAGASTVQGLMIHSFNSYAIELRDADGSVIAGNWIGLDQEGNGIPGNNQFGIYLNDADGVRIGGTLPAERNVISGNDGNGIEISNTSPGTLIQGNYIGTDVSGAFLMPNGFDGIYTQGANTQIGGTDAGAGNVVSGSLASYGILINTATAAGSIVAGNFIGTDVTGTVDLGNFEYGVGVVGTPNVTIGGASPAARNIISGNTSFGIGVEGVASMNVVIQGNYIGTNATGLLAIPNAGGGIFVGNDANSVTIGGTFAGDGNIISRNSGPGVEINGMGTSGVSILGNSIHSNSGLGIDLKGGTEDVFRVTGNDSFDADQGPNGLTNSPTITNFTNTGTAVMLDFSISAQPSTDYRIEFFALAPAQVDLSGSGEGAAYLGSLEVSTDAAGQFSSSYSQTIGLPVDSFFTATLTAILPDVFYGPTSEFSPAMGPTGATYTWSGTTSSDWFNALNWTPNGVPGAFDTAIYSGGTNPIQLNNNASVFVFEHSAGAMLGTGQLFVRDSLTWTGGSQDGLSLLLVEGATGSLNSGAGPLVWNSGNFLVAGMLTLAGSGMDFNAGNFTVSASGIFTLNAGMIDQNGAATPSIVSNTGKIEKLGTGAFGIDTTQVDNFGSIESRAGSLTLTGYTGSSGSKLGLTGGNIQTGGTITLDTDGEIFGTGTITGNLNNNGGYVYVGIGEMTGILNLTGNYTQSASGTLAADLRGTTPGTNYDQFSVGGSATISGVLNVTILPGYTPSLGHTLNVLTSTGLTGTFSFVVGEGAFSTNYTSTNAQLVRNGQSYTWDAGGVTDTSWFNPLNWSPDGLPGTGDVAVLNSNATITLDTADVTVADFIQSNGTLTGSKVLNILGALSWNGGTQAGTGTTQPGSESSTVLGGAAKTLDTRTLFVQGAGSSNSGSALTLDNAASLQIAGLYEVLIATPFLAGGSGGTVEIRPESTLRKSGATGTTIPAGLTFTNNGALEVLGGTFSILAGGQADDAVFRITPSAVLNFNSTVGYGFSDGISFEGGGTAALIGGTLGGSEAIVNVALNTAFNITGGSLSASNNTFTFNGPLQWSGGSLTGTGIAGINGAFNISGTAAKTLSEWVLNIAPSSAGVWNGTGNITVQQNARINVGGTVNLFSALDVIDGDSTGAMVVFPTGLFRKDGGGITDIQIPFSNDGAVTVTSAGTLNFTFSYNQGGGSLSVGSGSFVSSVSGLQINGGLVSGTGTITGALNNSGGIVSPGNGINSTGILTITGDYTQGNDGELFIEAQGTTPGTGYDQLQVGGNASLDRLLSFVTFNGYNAVAPANFSILTSTGEINGTFPVTNLPPNGSVNYTMTGVNVAFATGDLVVNGTVGDDIIVLRVEATLAGYTINGGVFTPLGAVSGFTFNGGDGNDILIIDLANGNPIPAMNGVTYDGQTESGGFDDKLMILDGAQGAVDYNFGNATNGNVLMSNFGLVNYASISQITNTGSTTDVNFNFPVATNVITLSDDDTPANSLSRLSAATLPQLDFASPTGSLSFNSSSSDDTLTITTLPNFNASLTIGSAAGLFKALTFAGAVTLAADKNLTANVSSTIHFANADADILASGMGAISLTTARNIALTSGSRVITENGGLTLSANATGTGQGSFIGVEINNALVQATGTGVVSVTGRGGNTGLQQFGVLVQGGGDLIGGTSGTMIVNGTGGVSGGVNAGVHLTGFGSTLSSSGADVSVTGQGGGDAGTVFNIGVIVGSGFSLSAGGAGSVTVLGTGSANTGNVNFGVRMEAGGVITSSGGDVSVTGVGGGAGASDVLVGVYVEDSTITAGGSGAVTVVGSIGTVGTSATRIGVDVRSIGQITSAGGDVFVTGTGGNASGTDGDGSGIRVTGDGQITAGGTGTVTVTGTGGAGVNSSHHGVLVDGQGLLSNLARIGSANGTITITAIAGNTTSSALLVGSGTAGRISTGSDNTLIINADSVSIGTAGILSSGTGPTTLNTQTPGTQINLGGADAAGTLGLTDVELDLFTAGTVQIGNANSGAITISAAITHANHLSLTTGAGVTFNNAVTMAVNKNFTVSALGTSNGTINFANANADLATTGTGAISLTTVRNILMTTPGASVMTANGDITMNANQEAVQTAGDFFGIRVDDGLIEATDAGNITINGRGGIDPAGVFTCGLSFLNTPVRTNSGTITMAGVGGQTLTDQNNGLQVHAGGIVESTGGGSIDLTGTGGGRTSGTGQVMHGIRVLLGGIVRTTGAGDITLTGTGGAVGSASDNYGVRIDNASAVTSSGSGTITINATGGANNAPAFRTDTGTNRLGFDGVNPYSGNIVINADSMDISGAVIQTTGNVTLRQNANGTQINLGAADSAGVLGLTDAELDQVTAGTLEIGDNNSGAITVSAAISHSNSLSLATGTGVTFNDAVTMAANKNFTVNALGTSNGTINLANANADISATGTGAIFLATQRDISMTSGSSIATVDGDLTLSANAGAAGTGSFTGVLLADASLQATGAGVVSVSGLGGDTGAGNSGVRLTGTASITGGTTGSMSISGTGGASTGSNNVGVTVSGGMISSNGANVLIIAIGGGSGASATNWGLGLSNSAIISAGSSGNVDIIATGGVGSGIQNYGVMMNVSSSTITSSGGNVSVTGLGGGTGVGGSNHGILIGNSNTITAGGAGIVVVVGTGGATTGNSNVGVFMVGGSITSATGNVQVVGTGAGSGASGFNYGVNASGTASISSGGGTVQVTGIGGVNTGTSGIRLIGTSSIATASNGALSLTTDGFDMTGGTVNSGTGITTIRQYTNGWMIALGGADVAGTTLGLTDAELDFFTSGVLQIGSGDSGAITVSGAITHGNHLTLTTGAGVIFNDAVTMELDKDFTVSALGTSNGTINFATANADLAASGTGAISLTTVRDFNMFPASGWSMTTANGNITLNANQQVTQTAGVFYGVQASNGLIEATGSGNIVINARGGITAAATFAVGIAIDPNTTVRTNTGSVTMSGVGGQSGTGGNNGVQVHSGSVVESTGGGYIDLTGIGGITSGSGQGLIGIRVLLGGIVRTTGAGAITLTGTGGAVGAASDNYGVRIDNAGLVTSSGSGTITINATGGANNAPAFRTDTGTNRLGFDGTNTFTGNIVINADSMDIADAIIQTTGTATLRQKTNSLPINLGGADSAGTLGLTDAELAQVTAGTLQIGNASSGAITVSAAITHGNHLSLTTGAGVTFNDAVTMAANKNFTVSALGTADGTINFANANADLAASGTGAISLTTARNTSLTSGSSITTVNGDLTLSANNADTGIGDFAGLEVSGALVQATGTGIVSVTGRGGNGAGGLQFGISLVGTGSIIGGTTGTMLISGTGGTSAGNSNIGVVMGIGGTMISSGGADIQIAGLGGGTGASTSNSGFTSNGTISTAGSGSVTISATGGSTTGTGNHGLAFGGGALVTTTGLGHVMVTGQGGGTGASFSNFGISMINANTITSGGGGNVTVSGTGGVGSGNNNIGVSIQGTSEITSSGNVTVTGTGGGIGASTNNLGVFTFDSGSISTAGSGLLVITGIGGANTAAVGISLSAATGSISTSADGTLTLITDGLSFSSGTASVDTSSLSIRPFSAGIAIDLGGADVAGSTLGLTDAELDRITAGLLHIGDNNSGTITVSNAITHANNLSLSTGAGVSGAGALTLSAGKNLGIAANGAINLSGAITVPGETTLEAGAANNITLTNAGNALATVSIGSGATVSLRDDGGFDLGASNISTLLSVQSDGAITQSGVLSGSGALTKLGTGTLTLSSVNTYTGVTDVSVGTLIVNGSLANGGAATDVNVTSGATLGGSGTIGGTVSNSGTVEPGEVGTTGTLTISGDYTQDASGILAVELGGTTAGSQYDVLSVAGSATLAGTLNISNINGFTPAGGNNFRVVQSAGNPGSFAALGGQSAGFTQQPDATGLVIVRGGSVFTWDAGGGADTDWFNSLNWSGDVVPTPQDSAELLGNFTATLTAPVTIANFTQSDGIITGTGALTITSGFIWTNGTISGSSTLTISPGATLTLSNGGANTLDARQLVNNGTVTQLGTNSFTLTNSAVITSNTLWQIDGDADILSGSGANVFTIGAGGSLSKISGTGNSDINVALNHTDGTGITTDIAVQTGALRLFGGGTWDGTDPDVSSSASLEIAGGTLSITNRQVYANGAGTVRINGGTLDLVDAQFSTDGATTFDFSSGTVTNQGDNDLVVFGPAAWSGGNVVGASTSSGIQFYGDLAISGSANRSVFGQVFDFAGGVTTFSTTGSINLVDDSGWNNRGVMNITGNGGFTHSGTAGAFFASIGNGTTTGILRKNDTSTTNFGAGVEFSASGLLELNAGTLNFAEPSSLIGTTVLQGGGLSGTGTIELTSGAQAGQEGILAGAGSISANFLNTSGVVHPGGISSIGNISFTSNYTQAGGGALGVELSGTSAGQYDVITISGTAMLSGALQITNFGGYTPLVGDNFRVVQSAVNPGSFPVLSGQSLGIIQLSDASGLLIERAGTTFTWDAGGGVDTNWFNPLNWSADTLPTQSDGASITLPVTVTLGSDVQIDSLDFSDGMLIGGGKLTVDGLFEWSGGTVATPVATASITTISITGSGTKMLNGTTMTLAGFTTMDASISLVSSATLENSGSFEIANGADILGSGTFHHLIGADGQVTKTGLDLTEIAVAFLNGSGLVVNDGTVNLSGGGNWGTNVSATVLTGAILDFAGGTHTFAGGNVFSGEGTTRLSGGTISLIGSAVSVAVDHPFEQTGGTITGGDFNIAGIVIWSGGTQNGTGTTRIIGPGGTLTISDSGSVILEGRTIDVNSGASITMGAGSALALNAEAAISVSGTLQIDNAEITDPNSTGGDITIRSGGAFSQVGNAVSSITPNFINDGGIVDFVTGNTSFLGAFQQNDGTTFLGGGNATFATPAVLDGGVLGGFGTITGSVINNGANISPGESPGSITFTGDLTLGDSSTVLIEIGGISSPNFDQIIVGGLVSFGGSLEATLTNGFTFGEGQSIVPISAGSRSGAFNYESLPPSIISSYGAQGFALNSPFLPPGVVRIENLPGVTSLLISELAPVFSSGVRVSGLGDLNGDTIADFAFSAPNLTPAGETYVIFGRSAGFSTIFDASTLNGANGFKIIGGSSAIRSGSAIASAGDVNNDGINDILIADVDSDSRAVSNGTVYVLFGKSGGYAASIDLSTLTAADGLVITGIAAGDAAGFEVRGAGDVNGDTIADFIIGVPQADANGLNSGSAYVIFGSQNGLPQPFSLAAIDGTNGFRINGRAEEDRLGESVSGAGDINSDGFDDIIIGTPNYNGVVGVDSGAAFVIFGKASGFAATLEVTALDGKNGFVIEGRATNEQLGISVSAAGDFNNDGFDDLIIASRKLNIESENNVSAAYLIFGKARGYQASLDLSKLTGANGFRLLTEQSSPLGSISVASAGDFNNDGIDDIVIGSPTSNNNSGVAYLMFGRTSGFAPELELVTLNDTTGFRFYGDGENQNLGLSVASAGDVNDDGSDDLLVAAQGSKSGYLIKGFGTREQPVPNKTATNITFNDVDGDLITIKVTRGKITADMLVFGAGGELQLVDLTAAKTLKDGANITFSVKANGGNGTINVGAIVADGLRLGTVKVTGDLGRIIVGNGDPLKPALKQLIVGSIGVLGDATQVPGTENALKSEIRGALPKLIVKGAFTNATVDILGRLGSSTIFGEFSGTGAFNSVQFQGLAALGRDVVSQLTPGITLASSGLSAGSIGSLNLKQSLTNSSVKSSGGISNASIGGSLNKGAIVAAGAIRVVKVFGAITSDDPSVPSVVAALASPPSVKPSSAIAINTLIVRGNVLNAEILLGYNSDFTPINGDASAGKVTILGNFTASSLVAGVKDETTDGFGRNDIRIGAPLDDPTPLIVSRIANLIIKGVAEGSDLATDSFGISAQQIKAAKINGVKVVLDKVLKDNIALGTKNDFQLVEVI